MRCARARRGFLEEPRVANRVQKITHNFLILYDYWYAKELLFLDKLYKLIGA